MTENDGDTVRDEMRMTHGVYMTELTQIMMTIQQETVIVL